MTTTQHTPSPSPSSVAPTHILGAGWAGMIAAEFWPTAQIYERDPQAATLTGTTGAFIRCRNPNAAMILQAPCRNVAVHRAVANATWDTHTNVQPLDAALYARKTAPCGVLSARSIHSCTSRAAMGNGAERYLLLPDDLVAARQRANTRVRYGATSGDVSEVLCGATPAVPVVSTLPLDLTLRHLGTNFRAPLRPERTTARGGFVLETELRACGVDFCWTVYVPSSNTEISRITITGGRAIVEVMPPEGGTEYGTDSIEAFAAHALFQLFNVMPEDIVQWNWHRVHKIAATPEYVAWAHEVVYRLSVERGIYSLGRAATGRRGVTVDDLPQDCRVINKLLRARSACDYVSARDVAREGGQ